MGIVLTMMLRPMVLGEICDGLFNCAHIKFHLWALLEIVSVLHNLRFMTVTTLLNVSMRGSHVLPVDNVDNADPTSAVPDGLADNCDHWHNLFNHKGVMTYLSVEAECYCPTTDCQLDTTGDGEVDCYANWRCCSVPDDGTGNASTCVGSDLLNHSSSPIVMGIH